MIKKITQVVPDNINTGEDKVIEGLKTLSVTTDEAGNIQTIEATSIQVTSASVLKTRHDGSAGK